MSDDLAEFLALVGTNAPEEGGIGLYTLTTCGRCGGEARLLAGCYLEDHQCDAVEIVWFDSWQD